MPHAHRALVISAALVGLIVGLGSAWLVLNIAHRDAATPQKSFATGTTVSTDVTGGPQLVMAVVGSSQCGASRGSALASAILSVRDSMRAIAGRHALPFASVGIAVDNDPDAGIAWLRELGGFDEVASGARVLNSAVDEFVSRQPHSLSATPQVIVTLRTTVPSGHSELRVTSNDVLIRMLGRDDILARSGIADLDSLLPSRDVHMQIPTR